MAKRTKLRIGDRLLICGEEYALIKNLYAPKGSIPKGWQFRAYLVEEIKNRKKYVAKITEERDYALNELRACIYLKNKGYPERYYAEMVAFDHKAQLIRSNKQFYVILLKYLPEEKFQLLDEYLRKNPAKNQRQRLADKLKRRVNKLHELGISHSDIREANIMVKETKRGIGVRLIDFGLSKFGDEEEIKKDNKKVENLIKKKIKL